MDYRIVPMVDWPGEGQSPFKRGDFGTTYARTLAHLQREVTYLEGSHVVFQLDVSESDIRQDGRLYAGRDPKYPGIIVTFNSKHGPLSYFCDHYSDWRSNLRAITITLQYLRRIDEHEVNKKGAQYEGYKRLPAAGETGEGRKRISTDNEAAAFIAKHFPEVTKDQLLASSWLFEAAYKNAAKKLHPDNSETGDDEAFVDLQDAAALLKQRHSKIA